MIKVGIVGGGPAGLMCAISLKKLFSDINIVVFEKNDIASTLLPTGGGRCNLTHLEADIRRYVQNYPRGEKFLYGVFNQFFVNDTIEFFKEIGIDVYAQNDDRVFPVTDKSLDVIFALKNEVKRLGIKVVNASIEDIEINETGFSLCLDTFDRIVIATGGKNIPLLHKIGHNIIPQKPALSSLEIEQKYFSDIPGVSLRNVSAIAKLGKHKEELNDDILFTHKGISGPLVYKISSLFARDDYNKNNPLSIILNFIGEKEFVLQQDLDKNAHKDILNLVSSYVPKSLAKLLLVQNNIDINKKCHQISKQERIEAEKFLTSLELYAIAPVKGGEIVSAGGVDLKEINAKTMESKVVKNLYFCGEVVDIDGFCGGYNLQNCWSTGYVAAKGIYNSLI